MPTNSPPSARASSPPTAGALLRQIREAADIQLKDLAQQAGVSASTLSRFETGSRDLAPDTYAHTMAALATLIVKRAA